MNLQNLNKAAFEVAVRLLRDEPGYRLPSGHVDVAAIIATLKTRGILWTMVQGYPPSIIEAAVELSLLKPDEREPILTEALAGWMPPQNVQM